MEVKFSIIGIILQVFSDDRLSGKGKRGYGKLIWGRWLILLKVSTLYLGRLHGSCMGSHRRV